MNSLRSMLSASCRFAKRAEPRWPSREVIALGYRANLRRERLRFVEAQKKKLEVLAARQMCSVVQFAGKRCKGAAPDRAYN